MKKLATITAIIGCFLISWIVYSQVFSQKKGPKATDSEETNEIFSKQRFQSGDMIFQSSVSAQCKAIQLATHSPYSHCGLIFTEGEKSYVLEAVQPVTITALQDWIERGKDKHFVVKRLKNADKVLTTATVSKMKKIGKEFLGKNYDATFEWSDDRIYCSELIWKIYQRATGLSIGKLEKLGDFDLSSSEVKAKLKERYGDKIPLEEIVISPVSIFKSDLLVTVEEH
ncbi:YiiX family permuted papain-like enzyme [Sphingobacterium sp. SRCM116780]|uniref:YiiX family permuted papain-like enzyme n=1 Tax=Sphingobacterium sp. SRCM116780 TaxID=2907623 RepID=UPI001F386170|nr:YiiX family permuted papain-like enzyme [Sphingobacterium sp. SRCM116780]UIR54598.1 YiiX family permuted papain-like enzyme [Sphingobacterium sp. SRCM116780]